MNRATLSAPLMTLIAVGALPFASPVSLTSGCSSATTAARSPAAIAAINLPTTSLCDGSGLGTGSAATDLRARGASRRAAGSLVPGPCLVGAEHLGDFGERHREAVVQHERDPLVGRQPL